MHITCPAYAEARDIRSPLRLFMLIRLLKFSTRQCRQVGRCKIGDQLSTRFYSGRREREEFRAAARKRFGSVWQDSRAATMRPSRARRASAWDTISQLGCAIG